VTKPNRAPATVLSVSLAVLCLALAACTSTSGHGQIKQTVTGPNGSTSVVTSSASSSPPPTPKTTVHIKSLESGDGETYGVGMPVIVFFQHTIKSAKQFQAATKVTANGQPLDGAWFFETSTYIKGYPIEGHWRPQAYWPAHSKIHVDIPVKGLSGGGNFVFDNSLTLDFNIGASHIGLVDDTTHSLTIRSDGKLWGKFDVSLGANDTRTLNGTKVIMEKGRDIPMRGPGYYDPHVKFTQRLTYGGEYLHAAPWNCVGYPLCEGPLNNIGRADSSNGCTNLRPLDAEKLYHFLGVGDVVEYPNANGRRMQIGDGYGDWNVPWSIWQTGGLVPTT
jgi:lipoprotein-anchoring transpeptidase ErfK/SrfK